MSDLERVILRLQRDLAWAAINLGGKVATDAMDWLKKHPEPVMKEVDEEEA